MMSQESAAAAQQGTGDFIFKPIQVRSRTMIVWGETVDRNIIPWPSVIQQGFWRSGTPPKAIQVHLDGQSIMHGIINAPKKTMDSSCYSFPVHLSLTPCSVCCFASPGNSSLNVQPWERTSTRQTYHRMTSNGVEEIMEANPYGLEVSFVVRMDEWTM